MFWAFILGSDTRIRKVVSFLLRFSSSLKMLLHYLLVCIVSNETSTVILILVPLYAMCPFSLAALKIFLCIKVINNLNIVRPWCNFLQGFLCLSSLSFWICGLIVLIKFGKILYINSSNIFLYPPWDIITHICSELVHSFLVLYLLFSVFFLPIFHFLIVCIARYLSSLICFVCFVFFYNDQAIVNTVLWTLYFLSPEFYWSFILC